MAINVSMNVAVTEHWETFIRELIGTDRDNNASEAVRAALRELRQKEGEVFRPAPSNISTMPLTIPPSRNWPAGSGFRVPVKYEAGDLEKLS